MRMAGRSHCVAALLLLYLAAAILFEQKWFGSSFGPDVNTNPIFFPAFSLETMNCDFGTIVSIFMRGNFRKEHVL
ncbi:hypothetical protein M5K25_014052 [Dendrobium thyrsiflorum]|uniref:Uncharacterized protein n=1 Tax=Dendrobium thyrsiflorum TaxID=117978 RepID=A0ABD0UUX9_DENTH